MNHETDSHQTQDNAVNHATTAIPRAIRTALRSLVAWAMISPVENV
jgi:hypothetical protein